MALVSLGGGGGGGEPFVMKWLVFGMVVSLMLPLFLTLTCVTVSDGNEYEDEMAQLNSDYASLTGTTAATTTDNVWALSGIYSAYDGGTTYGYSEDGWLYGSRIVNYTPSQFSGSDSETYTVEYNESGYYTYKTAPTGDTSKSVGDVYTMVAMDVSQKSTQFFTSSSKTVTDSGYYYEYTGYRYAFSPLGDYTGVDSEGNTLNVTDRDTLSLVWYQNKSNVSGIAGQLMLTTDRGLAYITATEIVNAYDSNNFTATFKMDFNGVTMNILIRMNPTYLSLGETITDAYNNGHWSLMVSSPASATDYATSLNGFDLSTLFTVVIKLLTFSMDDYGFDTTASTLCSLVFVIPLYLALVTIALDRVWMFAIVAILAVVNVSGLLGWL